MWKEIRDLRRERNFSSWRQRPLHLPKGHPLAIGAFVAEKYEFINDNLPNPNQRDGKVKCLTYQMETHSLTGETSGANKNDYG
jgi:hypothetical protein